MAIEEMVLAHALIEDLGTRNTQLMLDLLLDDAEIPANGDLVTLQAGSLRVAHELGDDDPAAAQPNELLD